MYRALPQSRVHANQTISPCVGQYPHPQQMDDKLFEIAGLFSSVHVAGISSGLGRHGHRMAQCRECVITTLQPLPMQIGMWMARELRAWAVHIAHTTCTDGEPWIQVPCKIIIKYHNQARVCRPSAMHDDEPTTSKQNLYKVSATSLASDLDQPH